MQDLSNNIENLKELFRQEVRIILTPGEHFVLSEGARVMTYHRILAYQNALWVFGVDCEPIVQAVQSEVAASKHIRLLTKDHRAGLSPADKIGRIKKWFIEESRPIYAPAKYPVYSTEALLEHKAAAKAYIRVLALIGVDSRRLIEEARDEANK